MNITKVGILDFRKNPYKWIKMLPVEIVAKGKTLFYMVASVDSKVGTVTTEVSTVKQEVPTVSSPLSKGQNFIEVVDGYSTEWTWEWCHGNLAHEFTKGKLFKCQMATYKDKDDNIGMIAGKKYDHVYICMDCLVHLEKQIQEGGFEYGR